MKPDIIDAKFEVVGETQKPKREIRINGLPDEMQGFARWYLIVAAIVLVFGFIVMWAVDRGRAPVMNRSEATSHQTSQAA